MIDPTFIDMFPLAAGALTVVLCRWFLREPKVKQPEKPPETLADALKDGWAASDRMAKEIKALYHPPGCACAYCEITAGDDKDEPEILQPHQEDPPPFVNRYAKELEKKVAGLKTENETLRNAVIKLKGSPRERVISKTVERKSRLDDILEQLAFMADEGQNAVAWTDEGNGRTIQITVSPQRPPDEQIFKHGEPEPVRKIWFERDPKETDRQAMQRLAQVCQETQQAAEATKYVCYRDNRGCELA